MELGSSIRSASGSVIASVPWVLGADLLGDGFMLDLTCAAQYRSLVQLADIIVLPLSCVILGLGVCASSVPEALLCVHVRPPSRGLDRYRLVLGRIVQNDRPPSRGLDCSCLVLR